MNTTECNSKSTEQLRLFQVEKKEIVISKTAVQVSSNGGFLALSKTDRKLGLLDEITFQLKDAKRNRNVKDPTRILHELSDLLKQRVYQIALGYEDGIDANELRCDPLLQLSVGKTKALASQPMMSRLENWVSSKDLYRAWRALVELYVKYFYKSGEAIVLHIDSTDDPAHGQLGLFNGYFQESCFHPLLVTEESSGFPLGIFMRDGNVGSARDTKMYLKRILKWLRELIPGVAILIKGDCAFGVADLVNWFDETALDYILGVSGNSVLYREVSELEKEVLEEFSITQKPLQRFATVEYRAGTWQNSHPVVAKVEHTHLGMNKRFVVSNLHPDDPALLYKSYCVRGGGIESTIEQLKNGLRFDKTACHKMIPNQMRYLEHALAFILHLRLKQKLKKCFKFIPTVQTIIQKVLKIAAIVTVSARRILVQLSSSDPHTHYLMQVLQT